MQREYHKWHSPRLGHDMELLVFGHSGARVLVFPTRAGRFYDYENWGLVNALRSKIDQGWLQLYCLDSIDAQSFYCAERHPAERIRRHLEYERYVLHEVLPLTEVKNGQSHLIAHGCSMGAYHAANFAFRHPHLVSKVVALSGRYDLTRPIGDFPDLFDGYYDEDIYFNMPCHYLTNLRDSWIVDRLRGIDAIFAVGEADPFLPSNQQLSDALHALTVRHSLHFWSGRAHKARYWQPMVANYL